LRIVVRKEVKLASSSTKVMVPEPAPVTGVPKPLADRTRASELLLVDDVGRDKLNLSSR